MDPTMNGTTTDTSAEANGHAASARLSEPTLAEIGAEWGRYQAAMTAGRVDPECRHLDEFVAFYDDRVIDYDADPVAPLRDRAAEIQRQQPEAAERGERQRDQQDGADADAPRSPEAQARCTPPHSP